MRRAPGDPPLALHTSSASVARDESGPRKRQGKYVVTSSVRTDGAWGSGLCAAPAATLRSGAETSGRTRGRDRASTIVRGRRAAVTCPFFRTHSYSYYSICVSPPSAANGRNHATTGGAPARFFIFADSRDRAFHGHGGGPTPSGRGHPVPTPTRISLGARLACSDISPRAPCSSGPSSPFRLRTIVALCRSIPLRASRANRCQAGRGSP